ncbi:50S ribosomal protein L6 [bacterium]|nr:50S ribosomal protein L6 [bacterium]
MSRIGKKPVVLPNGVKVNITGSHIEVEGKLGKLSHDLVGGITISQEDDRLVLLRQDDTREQKAFHGLGRALVQNLVTGVSEGYEKQLHVIGTGFSAEVIGPWIKLNVGYSHDIYLEIPAGLEVRAEAIPRGKGMHPEHQANVFVKGIHKEDVGKFSAEIRGCRKPENYKGKGIRYSTERVIIKAGKAGA